MNNTYIELKNISYSYNKGSYPQKRILHNLSLQIKTGETTVIMGPSGSGKTTLLGLLSGLLSQDCGEIVYPMERPHFSMVFQENRLIESISVRNNLKLTNNNLSDDSINKLLDSIGLSDCQSKKAENLSGGEKRRLAILRALSCEYDILLLDEPFTGMDQDTKHTVMDYVKEQTFQKTVILVTHNEEEAAFFSNKAPLCLSSLHQ